MRTFSFRDLRLIPMLSKYNEIELLHPTMDKLVFGFLGQLGFDLDHPIEYIPAKHRDLRGKVEVGFRAVGKVSSDREFINSKLCSLDERLIATSYSDFSLTREMATLMGTSSSSFIPINNQTEAADDFPEELIEKDYEEVSAQILNLEKICEQIRGSRRNEYGGLRAAREYV